MSKTNKLKQNIVLCLVSLLLVVSLTAVAATIGLFLFEESDDVPVAVLPLVIEPSRLDFQGVGKGVGETHDGIVYLENQTDKEINLLFVESSCRCSTAELPCNTIRPGEKLPMKCTLSTAGTISDSSGTRRSGGEIWIAYGFDDADNHSSGSEQSGKAKGKPSPMYARIILAATIDPPAVTVSQ